MFCIALDLHEDNTYGVVLDDKSGNTVWEGNFASTFRAAKEVLEPYFVKGAKVAIEATSCFYPMYDGLKTVPNISVHVVNTIKLKKPAVKTDRRDAQRIAHLLRRNELPFAYIPPKELRLQRELCTLRVRLVHSCTQCKNRISAILHKEGKRLIGVKDAFSKKGLAQLSILKEGISRKEEFAEELDLLAILQKKQKRVEKSIEEAIGKDSVLKKRVELIDSIPGFALTLSFVCATELGPISRFGSPEAVAAYAGMYPCVASSGGKTRHATYNINYHLVWIPKTRMKVLVKPFDGVVKYTIRRVCAYNGWTPMALQVMPDHVHFFVSAPPKWAPAQVVQSLKAWTSRDLRERFSVIRNTRYSDDFWASSYYCGTAGHVSAEVVARYIQENMSGF